MAAQVSHTRHKPHIEGDAPRTALALGDFGTHALIVSRQLAQRPGVLTRAIREGYIAAYPQITRDNLEKFRNGQERYRDGLLRLITILFASIADQVLIASGRFLYPEEVQPQILIAQGACAQKLYASLPRFEPGFEEQVNVNIRDHVYAETASVRKVLMQKVADVWVAESKDDESHSERAMRFFTSYMTPEAARTGRSVLGREIIEIVREMDKFASVKRIANAIAIASELPDYLHVRAEFIESLGKGLARRLSGTELAQMILSNTKI